MNSSLALIFSFVNIYILIATTTTRCVVNYMITSKLLTRKNKTSPPRASADAMNRPKNSKRRMVV